MKFRPRCLQAALKTPLDAPAWRPRQPRSHPRDAQDAPRAAQELPQSRPGSDPQAPWGEDTPQGSPRLPPDLDFGPFWRRFVKIFERILDGFLDGFLERRNGQIDRIGRETDRQNCSFVTFRLSAVAGTQLCCALDPPRQALCLRMAYRVPYPNPPPLCGTAC